MTHFKGVIRKLGKSLLRREDVRVSVTATQPLPPPGARTHDGHGTKCVRICGIYACYANNRKLKRNIQNHFRTTGLFTQPKQLKATDAERTGRARDGGSGSYGKRYGRNKWIIRIKYGFSLMWCWMEEILSAVFVRWRCGGAGELANNKLLVIDFHKSFYAAFE